MTGHNTQIPALPELESIPSPSTPRTTSTETNSCVVWHCRQLRTDDHAALQRAAENYTEILPVFIFDPEFYTDTALACDSRIKFLHESLQDLKSQYQNRGGDLTFCHGDPTTVLERFTESGWDIITTAEPTGRYGLERDNNLAETCNVEFVAGDGLIRTNPGETSREQWSQHAKNWFTNPRHSWDEHTVTIKHIDTGITPTRISNAYNISPNKTGVPAGGRANAIEQLHSFTSKLSQYPHSISAPGKARTGTSGLSAYLRFGCLSPREVYQYITENGPDGTGKNMFLSRLFWNRHYTQKLADWPGWMDTAVNPVMRKFHSETHDPDLVTAWKHGKTGYPMVDASMRCLKETGWLNFRMRAMCASFLCDLLEQPWKIGADWFYYHLIDADPAINYTQFQTQAGVVGVNMMRVYNPRKQVREQDPDGNWIRKWVPELRGLPSEFIDRPERTPVHVQNTCGVHIGTDYPYPIIEYEHARERILTRFNAVKHEAQKALENPVIAARASLSQNTGNNQPETDPGNTKHTTESDSNTQTSLSQFTG